MRRVPRADTVLRLVDASTSGQWTCHSCRRLQASSQRQFHTTPIAQAADPWYRRMRNTIFGNKEEDRSAKAVETQRDTAQEIAHIRDPHAAITTKTDEKGNVYEVAATVDDRADLDYVPATTWLGLERIGGEEWVRQQQDEGDEYIG